MVFSLALKYAAAFLLGGLLVGLFAVIPAAIVGVGIAYLLIDRATVSIYRAPHLNREAARADRFSNDMTGT